MEFNHTPVLLNEVLEGLNINPSGIYLDCTLGGAGHSSEIVKRLNGKGILIGVDKDIEAIKSSSERLSKISNVIQYDKIKNDLLNKTKLNFLDEIERFKAKTDLPICLIIKDDFKNSFETLQNLSVSLDGILIDLGVSSYQIDTPERGFSFRTDALLDMRMDQSQSLTAKDIVNNYSESDLIKLFYKYGEEEFSKAIARNIVKARELYPIIRTSQLNDIIESSLPKKIVFSRGGAAKKVFQALRIEVNEELANLSEFIKNIVSLLKKEGRICVISFHSLEDRIVKDVFKELAIDCLCPPSFPKCMCGGHNAIIKIISNKPLVASQEELSKNTRSASAKLRISQKV